MPKFVAPDPTNALLAAMQVKESSTRLVEILIATAVSDDQKETVGHIQAVIEQQNFLISTILVEYVELVDVLAELANKIPE